MDFKYTINNDRKIFASFLKEIGIIKMMGIIPKVPWDTYNYSGECTLISACDDNHPGEYISREITAISNYMEDNKPYRFSGGCVYELHTKSKPDVHNYMDPTGDVDVLLN